MPRGGARPGGGRPKGSRNKKSGIIAKKMEELGCDPIEGMIHVALESHQDARETADFKEKQASLKLAGDMYKELSQYIYPKLRSVEVTGDPDKPLAATIQILPVSADKS